MKWQKWFNVFLNTCQNNVVFGIDELVTAWRAGKTPEQVALANDGLLNEYEYDAAA